MKFKLIVAGEFSSVFRVAGSKDTNRFTLLDLMFCSMKVDKGVIGK